MRQICKASAAVFTQNVDLRCEWRLHWLENYKRIRREKMQASFGEKQHSNRSKSGRMKPFLLDHSFQQTTPFHTGTGMWWRPRKRMKMKKKDHLQRHCGIAAKLRLGISCISKRDSLSTSHHANSFCHKKITTGVCWISPNTAARGSHRGSVF